MVRLAIRSRPDGPESAEEGTRVAKAQGRLCGRQPKLNPRQEAHLVALPRAGEHSTAELSDLLGVGRSTVYRAVERGARRRQRESSLRTGSSIVR